MKLFPVFFLGALLRIVFANSSSDTDNDSSNHAAIFEIYLPYRLDFVAEMKLTSIFPRKFMYALKNYTATKEKNEPVLSMPNCSSGAIKIAGVYIRKLKDLNELLDLMSDLSKRVFRTGLNEETAGGNFRIPLLGIGIDPTTKYIYSKHDLNYPTDSNARFVTFMKSFYYRLAKAKFKYEIYDDIRLDQLVLGMVESIDEIDLPAFSKLFSTFHVGFVTFNKILVMPAGNRNEKKKSIFYFDHMSHEPIIGIENTVETAEPVKNDNKKGS